MLGVGFARDDLDARRGVTHRINLEQKVVVQAVAGAAVFVLNIPSLILGVLALAGHVWVGWLCLGLALVIGSATLFVGTWWGARIYERRAPELLADLSRIR